MENQNTSNIIIENSCQKTNQKSFLLQLIQKKLLQTNQKPSLSDKNPHSNSKFEKPLSKINQPNSFFDTPSTIKYCNSITSTPYLKKNLFTNQLFNTTSKKIEIVHKIPTFLNKKRKILSSEEIELQKIEKEREEIKKMIHKNREMYENSQNYTPMKIIPKPLTTFKPFNLSSNYKNKYLKERQGNTLYEINKLNQKIREKMEQKIEALTDTKTKNQILLNNTEYLKNQNSLYRNIYSQIKRYNSFCISDNTSKKEEDKFKEPFSEKIHVKEFLTPQKMINIDNSNSVMSKLVLSNSKISQIYLNYLTKK